MTAAIKIPAQRQIDPSILAEIDRLGSQYDVSSAIHPADFIFWFVHDHASFVDKGAEAAGYYFSNGQESARKVSALVRQFCTAANPELLEFAAGYGCVTRHLKNDFADARVTACDIHDEALDFIAAEIGVVVARSAHVPEGLNVGKFDAAFAISFFSHMPKSTWQRWLKALSGQVKPGGLVIFTTHGHASLPIAGNPELDNDGFWFRPFSEQQDLDSAEYGTAMTSFEYVSRQIAKTGGLRLLRFEEAFWYGHQDVYVLRRLGPD